MSMTMVIFNEEGYELFLRGYKGKKLTYLGRRKTRKEIKALERKILKKSLENDFENWIEIYIRDNIKKNKNRNKWYKAVKTGIYETYDKYGNFKYYRVKIKNYGKSYEIGKYKNMEDALFIREMAEKARSLGAFNCFYELNKELFYGVRDFVSQDKIIKPLI